MKRHKNLSPLVPPWKPSCFLGFRESFHFKFDNTQNSLVTIDCLLGLNYNIVYFHLCQYFYHILKFFSPSMSQFSIFRYITQNLCLKWIHKKRMLSDLELPLDNIQTEVVNQWLKEPENSESWKFGTDVANKLSLDYSLIVDRRHRRITI